MERITGLKGHHIGMAKHLQPGPCLSRRQTQMLKIIVAWQLQHLQPTGDAEWPPFVHLGHQGMAQVQRAKHLLGFLVPVPFVDFLDRHNRQ